MNLFRQTRTLSLLLLLFLVIGGSAGLYAQPTALNTGKKKAMGNRLWANGGSFIPALDDACCNKHQVRLLTEVSANIDLECQEGYKEQ